MRLIDHDLSRFGGFFLRGLNMKREKKMTKLAIIIKISFDASRFAGPFPSLRASDLRSLTFLVFDRDHFQAVASSFEVHGLPLQPVFIFNHM